MSRGKGAVIIVAAFGIVFCGVTAAIQFNKWLDARREPLSAFRPQTSMLQNAKLDQVAGSSDFRAAAKAILPSVVSIDTQVEGENWLGEHVVQDAGQGSGVVISQDGYIVTNNHVVRVNVGFGQTQIVDKVRVTFFDGSSVSAKIVGTDPRSDLAVLKTEKTGLNPIEMGDSSKLEVGEWVVAVGNPLGFANTLSVGVVSNVGRQLPGSSEAVFIDGIQTDAAINPGNSGGALCDVEGRLVGINSSIATTTRANIGIGFAIPVNRMRQVVDDIVKFGYARYGQMGVQVLRRPGILGVAEARQELQNRTNSPSEPPKEGAVVLQVSSGSVAAQAGIHSLDVITEINGKKVRDVEDFQEIMSPLKPGTVLDVKYWSVGKAKEAKVTLGDVGKADL
ncbi:MAG: trypsin-like peptidase domain-containing protein [Armatimonadetes bacterium]|nr:trypsin-like peptidase domain-containing protein [Armatimonadota bacterium]